MVLTPIFPSPPFREGSPSESSQFTPPLALSDPEVVTGRTWKKQAWLHHFSLGQEVGRLAGCHFVFTHGSPASQFPSRGFIWDNNLTSFANMTLQVLYFLPSDMALNVHKVGAMDWDPGLFGIWT